MVLAAQFFLLLHLIGFAALFGGILVQLRSVEPEINAAMLHGAYVQLITGVVLAVLVEVGPDQVSDDPVNEVKLGVKLLLTLVIAVLVIINRRFASIPRGLLALIGCLTLGTAVIAVLWQ